MIFYALDRQDAIRRLRGVQATGFWLNEAMQLQRDVVALADLRHGRYPRTWPAVSARAGTGLSPTPTHPTKTTGTTRRRTTTTRPTGSSSGSPAV